VEIGSHINKGEEIMIYEAMKMQNIIRAPFDGTVEQIFVKTGEKVAKGSSYDILHFHCLVYHNLLSLIYVTTNFHRKRGNNSRNNGEYLLRIRSLPLFSVPVFCS
jgi:hypothetical protein